METNSAKIQPNSAMRFYCNFCDYKTNKKCNYDTHLISLRHSQKASQETLGNQIQPKISQIQLFCEKCNKQFYNRSGLWKHKNKNTDQVLSFEDLRSKGGQRAGRNCCTSNSLKVHTPMQIT